MTYKLNETHDPKAKSWLKSANAADTPFPIQNLPFGVFRSSDGQRRIGIAIGDALLDLRAATEIKLLGPISSELQNACGSQYLNDLMSLAPKHWSELRKL